MKKKFLYIIFLLVLFTSCSTNKNILGISKASGSDNYKKYKTAIELISNDFEIVDIYPLSYDSALVIMNKIDGLILSGGPDIHPIHFGKIQDTSLCSIDLHRDSLELALIDIAYRKKIPILGICRGLQILNVYNGGSLFTDIPTQLPQNKVVHQVKDGDINHKVRLDTNSIIYSIINSNEIIVNSNHHQSIDRLSTHFVATAYADDGIIEAIESKNINKHFVIAVQWHPERLWVNNNDENSRKLLEYFLEKIKIYKFNK